MRTILTQRFGTIIGRYLQIVNAEREKAQKTKDLIAQLEESEAAMKKL